MTPDKDKKFILDNISVTPQMVAQAREFILKNFDKNTRTLIENFLWNIEASLDNNKVFLRKDNPEPGLKKVAEHISWRLAACRAIKDMIRSNELSQDPKYQGPKYLDDGIPRIHWEKKDPSGSGMGSVWDFDEISIDIPLYVKLPFPYAHGQQAVKKDEPSVPAGGSMDKRKVFVVHGRSEKANKALFEFLRAIDLRPLEWGEAIKLTKKGSPYLGEIVEAGLSHTQATVVLLTGDDDVRLKKDFIKDDDPDHEKNLTPQPRPNVLLEAGMAFGKHPERTILVKLGTIREISDITGRYTGFQMERGNQGSLPVEKRKES
ncbi:MAG: nucleotide-binding protein [Thermodesulfobacteriota bacterium]|nr:nucleotide-binding protein [Thermodesulfobacteriota bacterium]